MARQKRHPEKPTETAPGQRSERLVLSVTALLCGAVVMVVELLAARFLAPLFGTCIVVWTAVIAVALLALAAGYALGGRVADRWPRPGTLFGVVLLAALTLSAILVPLFGRGIWAAMIALVVFGWMTFARLIRGEIMAAKERDYVLAAEVVGARNMRVLVRHIVPNAIYPVLILASMRIGDYVLSFATLSFLGVGTEIGYADWGQIISFARYWILSLDVHWYIIVYPGAALLLFGLGWNLIGDALRDILDPRLRSSRG